MAAAGGLAELAALLPASLAAALRSPSPPTVDEAASAVASALEAQPRFHDLLAALTDVEGSPCAKDAAGASAALRQPLPRRR